MNKAIATGAAALVTTFGGVTAVGAATALPASASNSGYVYYPSTSSRTTKASFTVKVT